MNSLIETLNAGGQQALEFAWPILWQSSVLIAVLLALDLGLRKKVRAAIRYALWLAVLLKLVLPPSLALPTSFAWWLRHAEPSPAKPMTVMIAANPDALQMPVIATTPRVLPATPSTGTPISSAASGLVLWSAVSLGLLFWLALRWRQVAREIHAAAPAPAWLNELLNEARVSARVRRTVPLRIVNRAMSPAVCGLFRPVILLPQSLVEQLAPAQLNAVLLHELMHLRRGDVWVNCAQALLQIFYWWHPLLWFANARIRRVREEAVDDAVVLALKQEADQYAPTLIEVAKLAFHRPLATLGLVGILESRRALRQRIERLLNFATPRRAGLSLVSVLGIAAFTAMAVPMGEAPAKSEVSVTTTSAAGVRATEPAPNATLAHADHTAGFQTRKFKVDPRTFVQILESAGGLDVKALAAGQGGTLIIPKVSSSDGRIGTPTNARSSPPNQTPPDPDKSDTAGPIQSAVIKFFDSLGVDLHSETGKSAFFDDRKGVLTVHASEPDLNIIEAAVQTLNLNPSQLTFKVRIVELAPGSAGATGTDWLTEWLLANGITPSAPSGSAPVGGTFPGNPPSSASGSSADAPGKINSPPIAAVTGILTYPQTRVVLDALEQRSARSLGEAQVTTLSGRQAQLQWSFPDAEGLPPNIPIQNPVLDLIGYVAADGYTIEVTVIPTILQFLGYDDPGSFQINDSTGTPSTPLPLPRFRVRQVSMGGVIWDGQTLVMSLTSGGGTGNQPNRNLIFLITATLIDPAGNRIHSDQDLPFAATSVPPQKPAK